ncbi:hypothetical protein ACJ73_01785 [Blastomyces percursus]|uniref:Uncharacterized protein n=1 Tax=Blastomyces percursus TaxID=1658174 RepID=A0A1J9QFD6_9EURO|nr:hypothetical protein ACJ73_01785 [Blastomyces percursus]
MPGNLKAPQLELIHHMIQSESLKRSEIAFVANCSKQTVTRIRCNLEAFGNVSTVSDALEVSPNPCLKPFANT